MERAVFVPDLERLPPSCVGYSRLYLGSEFCSWRLPARDELHRVIAATRERGMAFTLVTPFLDEKGLHRALALVANLPEDGTMEVIANDFGFLEAIAERRWAGTVVAGRLLTRQRRGPGFQEPVGATAEALEALRGSALDSPRFVSFLSETYEIRRFEIDNLLQGVAIGPLPPGVRLSIYRPWIIVTATRNCPWIFDGRRWQREDGCPRPCRGQALRMEPAEGGRHLILGGCAQFLEAGAGEEAAAPAVDRLVWQPDLPA